MPSLDAVRFDTTHWQPAGRGPWQAEWANDHGDSLALLLQYGRPGVPAVGDPGPAFRDGMSRQAGEAVQLLGVERRPVAGVPAVVVLMRTRKGTGWKYGAAVVLPFFHFSYSLVLVAEEHGITGIREAMSVFWQVTAGDDAMAPVSPEQDRLMDAALPAHPQARVRTYLDELLGSLTLSPGLQKAAGWPPTRLPMANGCLELRDGALLRRADGGRLYGRFPLDRVSPPRVAVVRSPLRVVVSLAGLVGLVLAFALLSGWWLIGACLVAGFAAVGPAFDRWQSTRVELDTPAGLLTWPFYEAKPVADAFCLNAAHLAGEGAPCPPSS